jgi:hypothetical protein
MGSFDAFVAVRCRFRFGIVDLFPVQFGTVMTLDTGHATLPEVNVSYYTFVLAHEFVTHAAAMACRARASHRRIVGEQMPVQQPTAGTGGLAYVAVTTASVATGTVIAKHFLHGWLVRIGAACSENRPVTFLRGMEAAAVRYRLLLVAFNTHRSITATRSSYQICMRFFFIFRGINASMAINTSDLAMVGLRKSLGVD